MTDYSPIIKNFRKSRDVYSPTELDLFCCVEGFELPQVYREFLLSVGPGTWFPSDSHQGVTFLELDQIERNFRSHFNDPALLFNTFLSIGFDERLQDILAFKLDEPEPAFIRLFHEYILDNCCSDEGCGYTLQFNTFLDEIVACEGEIAIGLGSTFIPHDLQIQKGSIVQAELPQLLGDYRPITERLVDFTPFSNVGQPSEGLEMICFHAYEDLVEFEAKNPTSRNFGLGGRELVIDRLEESGLVKKAHTEVNEIDKLVRKSCKQADPDCLIMRGVHPNGTIDIASSFRKPKADLVYDFRNAGFEEVAGVDGPYLKLLEIYFDGRWPAGCTDSQTIYRM